MRISIIGLLIRARGMSCRLSSSTIGDRLLAEIWSKGYLQFTGGLMVLTLPDKNLFIGFRIL